MHWRVRGDGSSSTALLCWAYFTRDDHARTHSRPRARSHQLATPTQLPTTHDQVRDHEGPEPRCVGRRSPPGSSGPGGG
jgi:hypothetical protein